MAINPTIARAAAAAIAVAAVVVVVILVIQLNAPAVEPAHLLRYRLGGTYQQIVVTAARGHCDTVKATGTKEDANSVRETVLVERSRGTCTGDIVFDEISFTLASPLAGRAVSDSEGSPLPIEAR